VIGHIVLGGHDRSFRFADRARITEKYFNPARRAAGIAAAAMKNVHARILDAEHKSPVVFRIEGDGAGRCFRRNSTHSGVSLVRLC
jgi:hypothetical protein